MSLGQWKVLKVGVDSFYHTATSHLYTIIYDATLIEYIFSFIVAIKGSALFYQSNPAKDLSIQVTGLKGLKSGKHGFHIHEYGDLTEGCKTAGPHFTTYKKN